MVSTVPKLVDRTQYVGGSGRTSTDISIPHDYVSYTVGEHRTLPPLKWSNLLQNLNWLHIGFLGSTPLLGFAGACYTPLRWETAVWAILYGNLTLLGMLAGYHRLWAHRSYNASRPVQYFLAVLGAAGFQRTIMWWARDHRAHHRYIDTDLDPYNARRGLLWSHIGWLFVNHKRGAVDISDLAKNDIVQWQYRHYLKLVFFMGVLFPILVAGLGWGDWKGGCVYAFLLRIVFVHHSIFCVNSFAHWGGEAPYDDVHSPRDHWILALITFGEGYHNFHHQFPIDYRGGIKWYQYDPIKWFVQVCRLLGLASYLKTFPENEIRKGQLTMQLKHLHEVQDKLSWPSDNSHLPVISWKSYQTQADTRPLICISGFIHDVSDFLDEHPGGRHVLMTHIGEDATTAFFGGVYNHSNAAQNLLAMKRVGILHEGVPRCLEDKTIPPTHRFRIVCYKEDGTCSCDLG